MKKNQAVKRGKSSKPTPQPAARAAQPRRSSFLASTVRMVTLGLTFAFVTTISAGVGATIALMAPLGFLPWVPPNSEIDPTDIPEMLLSAGVPRPVNVLIMGVDKNLEAEDGSPEIFRSRSDTMLLVRINPDNKRVSVLTIPRDTRVLIPDYGYTKINAANFEGGPKLAIEVVSETLNDIPIDRYIRISTGAFREFVDIVGGVEVFVPTRMEYEDKTQRLVIDLEPGLQTLNGEQAEGFMRYRKDLGDIGRGQRQQVLIKALQKQLATPATLTRLPQLLEVLQQHLDTNLSVGEMLALGQFSLQMDRENLHMVMLPGRFSGPKEYDQSFWLMRPSAIDDLMLTYFDVKPKQKKRRTVAGVKPVPVTDRVRLTVQNASGDPEGGVRMVEYLRGLGFRRVYRGVAWPEILAKTQVIPQWGDVEAAAEVDQLLEASELAVNSTGDLGTDLTIRVGNDWLKTSQAQASELPDL